MFPSARWSQILAAINGVMAVALGAFAAHGMTDDHAIGLMKTAATYQMVHAAASLYAAEKDAVSGALLSLGAMIFALSLYAIAFGCPVVLGAIAPIGGAGMIAGWLVLLYRLIRGEPRQDPLEPQIDLDTRRGGE